MHGRRRLAASALVLTVLWAVPVSGAAPAGLPRGVVTVHAVPPTCYRAGDMVTVVINNPSIAANGPTVIARQVYVAFYLQGYRTGNVGYAVTNGQIWYGEEGTPPGANPFNLYNYGSGQFATSTAVAATGTSPDWWGVWALVQWPDGVQEWQGWQGWCYA